MSTAGLSRFPKALGRQGQFSLGENINDVKGMGGQAGTQKMESSGPAARLGPQFRPGGASRGARTKGGGLKI